eukprot:scaffold3690_cov113-Isochrysis_galbana.AAC.11
MTLGGGMGATPGLVVETRQKKSTTQPKSASPILTSTSPCSASRPGATSMKKMDGSNSKNTQAAPGMASALGKPAMDGGGVLGWLAGLSPGIAPRRLSREVGAAAPRARL